jgi:hypothetical protein
MVLKRLSFSNPEKCNAFLLPFREGISAGNRGALPHARCLEIRFATEILVASSSVDA